MKPSQTKARTDLSPRPSPLPLRRRDSAASPKGRGGVAGRALANRGSGAQSASNCRGVLNSQPSTILLAVTGMSPAVLTATVWALAQEKEPVIPDRVVVITTISGRQAIERELLMPSRPDAPTVWQELRRAVLGQAAEKDPRLNFDAARLIQGRRSEE